MGRIRTIKPEFWNDEDIGELSVSARLTFIATWSLCDDEGLLPWTPAFIRAQVFAYDDITLGEVESILREIEDHSLVVPYKDAKGKSYGWILNFRKHQRIDKPQSPKHPLPSIQNPVIRKVYAERDAWCCAICGKAIDSSATNRHEVLSLDHIKPRSSGGTDAPSNIRATHFGCNASKKDKYDSGNNLGTVQECSDTEGNGKEGNKERNGMEQGMECADAPAGKPAPKPKRARTIPDDFQPSDAHRQLAAELGVSLPDEFAKFRDHFGANGKPMKDWNAALNNWLRRAKEFQRGNGSGQQAAGNTSAHVGFANREYTSHTPDWAREDV